MYAHQWPRIHTHTHTHKQKRTTTDATNAESLPFTGYTATNTCTHIHAHARHIHTFMSYTHARTHRWMQIYPARTSKSLKGTGSPRCFVNEWVATWDSAYLSAIATNGRHSEFQDVDAAKQLAAIQSPSVYQHFATEHCTQCGPSVCSTRAIVLAGTRWALLA